MKYELEPFHRDISDEELLADLRRVAEELATDHVTFREYKGKGRFAPQTLADRFGSWHAAIDKANLQRTINRNISDEELFVNLVEVWTALGRQPRSRDLRPGPSRFSWNAYAYRFRTWRKALAEFVRWANEGNRASEPNGAQRKQVRRHPETLTGGCVHWS